MFIVNNLNNTNNKIIPLKTRQNDKSNYFDRPGIPVFASKTNLALTENKTVVSNNQGDVLVKSSATQENSQGFFSWLFENIDAEYLGRTSPYYHYW
ncbi:MAG: hypothetical protein AB1782_02075 [Cyanobacteriota bacterium]